jgi:hypothetical protein
LQLKRNVFAAFAAKFAGYFPKLLIQNLHRRGGLIFVKGFKTALS